MILGIMALPLAFGVAHAATRAIPKPNTLPGLTSGEQTENAGRDYVGEKVAPLITNVIIGAAASGCLVFLIIGGIRYLMAYGEEEALGSAKKTIIFSIVGLLIAMFSYAIVALISGLELEKSSTPGPTSMVQTAYAAYTEEGNKAKDVLNKVFQKEKGVADGSTEFKDIQNLPFSDIKANDRGSLTEDEFIAQRFYGNVIKFALGIASILTIISFVVAGVMYITSRGDDEMMNKAKKIIIFSLVAVGIIASSYALTLGTAKLKDLFWK